jgi:hypothetical protein
MKILFFIQFVFIIVCACVAAVFNDFGYAALFFFSAFTSFWCVLELCVEDFLSNVTLYPRAEDRE